MWIKTYFKQAIKANLFIVILYFLILYQIFVSNYRISIYPLQLLLTQGIQGDTAIFVQQMIIYTWTMSIFLICIKAYHLRTIGLSIILLLTGFKLWIFIENFQLFWQLESLDMIINLLMAGLTVIAFLQIMKPKC